MGEFQKQGVIHMENEQTTEEQPVEGQPVEDSSQEEVEVQPIEPVESTETETLMTESMTDHTELLQVIADSSFYIVALQVVIICILLFNLFFVGLKAGKGQ